MHTSQYKNILIDSTVVVVGNGPSLNDTPLLELSRKYVTFGTNHIYRKPFTPTYYSFADVSMLDFLPLPEDFKPKTMFCRAEACIPGNNPIYPIASVGFSTDISNFVVFGGSGVYVLLQIAFYMGVKTVLLVGVDHHYPVAGQGTPSTMFEAGQDDPDHFACGDGRGYFVPKKWYSRPSLDVVANYFKTAEAYSKETGRKIINCTPGSKLDVFERGNISEWI